MENVTLKIESTIKNIKGTAAEETVIVAFSGGLDSTVTLFLAKEALGKKKVIATHVDFGLFTYHKVYQNVKTICDEIGVPLQIISGVSEQRSIMKGGPDCNLCTRKVKLGLIKARFNNRLILTGSNQSDSWGQYGIMFVDGFYAPLFHYSKKDIENIATYLNLKVEHIGENVYREGCKLKHLLKPLISMTYHGQAVSLANEILLQQINKLNLTTSIANVKIIGPLSRNIGLINVFPIPNCQHRNVIIKKISSIAEIDDCLIVDRPLELTIKANRGQFNNLRSRYWLERGRLQPEFAAPLKFKWLFTTNRRLQTFQVVAFNPVGTPCL